MEHLKTLQKSNTNKAEILNLLDPIFHELNMSQSAQKAIQQAKRKDRPSLNVPIKAKKFQAWGQDELYSRNVSKDLFQCPENIERKHMSSFSVEEFEKEYHKQKKPVIIKECTQNWKASKWTHECLAKALAEQRLKIGEDDDGQKIKVTMRQFMEYLVHNTDDSPLYLFENTNIVKQKLNILLEGYEVPKYFQKDLLSVLPLEERPLFRWFLMGPQRSGSTVHVDPHMTCAWNTSLVGHKRWAVFHQNVPKHILKGKEFRSAGYKDEAINYFLQILPKIKAKYSSETLGLVQFIQYPGETVFVPAGSWHAVLNLDDTIAVTQNFIHQDDISEGWRALQQEKKHLIPLLLNRLKEQNHFLYSKAVELDNQKPQLSQSDERAYKVQKQGSLDSFSQEKTNKQVEFTQEYPIQNRPRVLSQVKKLPLKSSSKTFSDDGSPAKRHD